MVSSQDEIDDPSSLPNSSQPENSHPESSNYPSSMPLPTHQTSIPLQSASHQPPFGFPPLGQPGVHPSFPHQPPYVAQFPHPNLSSTAPLEYFPQAENPPNSPIQNLNHAHHSISIKLTPTNYLLWSNQLRFFLMGQGIFDYITGHRPCPPPYSPDFALWHQQDAAIMSCLISSLSEPLMPEAIGKLTSKSLWDSLRTTYARAST